MDETSFTPVDTQADISAYEQLSSLDTSVPDGPPALERLERVLIRVIFVAKIIAIVGCISLIGLSVYGWSKNQTQSSWLLNQDFVTADHPICAWMQGKYETDLRNDTPFREYLAARGQQQLIDLRDNNRCLALDSLDTWLEHEKAYQTQELTEAYQSVLPKKFIWHTVDATPELAIIQEHAPENRINHRAIIQSVSQAITSLTTSSTSFVCTEFAFESLTADIACEVQTTPPLQPRTQALEFIKHLEQNQALLVTYPTSLDMSIDAKTQKLSTKFHVQITYIPARYESERLKNLSYDQ